MPDEPPHAEGMLIVAHPETNTLYVSDLLTPAPLEAYPRPSHAALDRFFAGWLEHSELAPDSVWTMHGRGPVTRAHLERARS